MAAVTSDFATAMRALHRAPEPEVLAPLLERAKLGEAERQGVVA